MHEKCDRERARLTEGIRQGRVTTLKEKEHINLSPSTMILGASVTIIGMQSRAGK